MNEQRKLHLSNNKLVGLCNGNVRHSLTFYMHFIPPTDSLKYPASHILNSIEIQSYQNFWDIEMDYEVTYTL